MPLGWLGFLQILQRGDFFGGSCWKVVTFRFPMAGGTEEGERIVFSSPQLKWGGSERFTQRALHSPWSWGMVVSLLTWWRWRGWLHNCHLWQGRRFCSGRPAWWWFSDLPSLPKMASCQAEVRETGGVPQETVGLGECLPTRGALPLNCWVHRAPTKAGRGVPLCHCNGQSKEAGDIAPRPAQSSQPEAGPRCGKGGASL